MKKLLSIKPFKISLNGKDGLKITIPALSGAHPGDKYFIEQTDNGIINLIPEKIFRKK